MSGSGRLDLVEVDKLILHERIIEHLLNRIVESIARDGYVINPIVVDERSMVVIDGMHRVEALRRLHTTLAPVYVVDYMSDEVTLHVWYRLLEKKVDRERVKKFAVENGLVVEVVDFEDAVKGLKDRCFIACFMIAGDEGLLALSSGERLGLVETYNYVAKLDARFNEYGLVYSHEEEALNNVRNNRSGACYLVPPLSKKEIIDTALSGRCFPPKTTRHVIKLRPLYLFTPLNLLMDENVEEAKMRYKALVSRLRWIDLPPNQFIDRFYEEEVRIYIQEDKLLLSKYPRHIRELIEKTIAKDSSS